MVLNLQPSMSNNNYKILKHSSPYNDVCNISKSGISIILYFLITKVI